jgi:hypothetical protein
MRRLLAVLLLAIVATAVHGAAATLGVSARPIGAGSAVVGRCHTGPAPTVTYSYGADNTVTGLAVSNLNAGCDGGHLQAVVTDAGGTALASGSASVAAGAASITFPPAPAAQVAGYRISIVT